MRQDVLLCDEAATSKHGESNQIKQIPPSSTERFCHKRVIAP